MWNLEKIKKIFEGVADLYFGDTYPLPPPSMPLERFFLPFAKVCVLLIVLRFYIVFAYMCAGYKRSKNGVLRGHNRMHARTYICLYCYISLNWLIGQKIGIFSANFIVLC